MASRTSIAGGSGTRAPGIHNAIAELAEGRIMALGRFDLPSEQEKFNFKIPLNYTNDLGKTWTYEASPFPAIGSVQRAVLLRLKEGPLLFCSFTDEQRYWAKRKGMTFKAADETEFVGYGLFAAVSFDEGKTWPTQRLITPGGPERTLACQSRDGLIQLVSSKESLCVQSGVGEGTAGGAEEVTLFDIKMMYPYIVHHDEDPDPGTGGPLRRIEAILPTPGVVIGGNVPARGGATS